MIPSGTEDACKKDHNASQYQGRLIFSDATGLEPRGSHRRGFYRLRRRAPGGSKRKSGIPGMRLVRSEMDSERIPLRLGDQSP